MWILGALCKQDVCRYRLGPHSPRLLSPAALRLHQFLCDSRKTRSPERVISPSGQVPAVAPNDSDTAVGRGGRARYLAGPEPAISPSGPVPAKAPNDSDTAVGRGGRARYLAGPYETLRPAAREGPPHYCRRRDRCWRATAAAGTSRPPAGALRRRRAPAHARGRIARSRTCRLSLSVLGARLAGQGGLAKAEFSRVFLVLVGVFGLDVAHLLVSFLVLITGSAKQALAGIAPYVGAGLR